MANFVVISVLESSHILNMLRFSARKCLKLGSYKSFFAISASILVVGCAEPPQRVNLITNSKDNPIIIPPNCPDWSVSSSVNYDNTPTMNYGCATVTNFGVMVEDPNDLVVGKSSNLTDSSRTAAKVRAYKSGGELGASSTTGK